MKLQHMILAKQKDELQKAKKSTTTLRRPKSGKLPKIKEEVLHYVM
jgi:hypothetical protein